MQKSKLKKFDRLFFIGKIEKSLHKLSRFRPKAPKGLFLRGLFLRVFVVLAGLVLGGSLIDYCYAQSQNVSLVGKLVSRKPQDVFVTMELPILGNVEFHKKGAMKLKQVFEEIKKQGLQSEIDVQDFRRSGGTFVPRHILRFEV